MIVIPSNVMDEFVEYYESNKYNSLIPTKFVTKAPIVHTIGIFIKFFRLNNLYVDFSGEQIIINKDFKYTIPDSAIETLSNTSDNDWINVVNYVFNIYSKWITNGKIPF